MKDFFKNFFNDKVKCNLKTAVISIVLTASVMGNGYLYESSKLNVPKATPISASSKNYQKQIDDLRNENSKLKVQIKEITSQKDQTQNKLISIQEENKNLSAKLSEIQGQKSQEQPNNSNGSSINSSAIIQSVASSQTVQNDNQNITVYITKTGNKYHRDGCKYLSVGKIPIDLKQALGEGYSPCSLCSPP